MRALSLLIFLLFYSATSLAQDGIDERKMVGFACFFEGRETKVVSKAGRLLKQGKYSRIRRMLESNNTAEQYLAVICLERLSAKGKVILADEEQSLIEQIKLSSEMVATCTGCIPHPGMALKDAFNAGVPWGATLWLDRHVE